jgi:hypothetical protein
MLRSDVSLHRWNMAILPSGILTDYELQLEIPVSTADLASADGA